MLLTNKTATEHVETTNAMQRKTSLNKLLYFSEKISQHQKMHDSIQHNTGHLLRMFSSSSSVFDSSYLYNSNI